MEVLEEKVKEAIDKYVEFNSMDPKEIGDFAKGFRIPSIAIMCGDANYILYRSDKLNPTTGEDEGVIDYIHHHKKGVKVYRTDDSAEGYVRKVPRKIYSAKWLVLLGDCMGFAYEDINGVKVEAKANKPYPELYTTPDGRALLVIEDKKRVDALIWGGKLGVERRGIVG